MNTRKRSREIVPERDSQGRFKRVCGSVIHDPDDTPGNYLIDLKNGKKVSKKSVDSLIENNICDIDTHFICKSCLSKHELSLRKAEPLELNEEENADSDQENDDFVAKCIDLGMSVGNSVRIDVNNLYRSSKMETWKEVNDYNVVHWLRSRPPELLHLLGTICEIDVNTAPLKKLTIFAKAIELLYYCINSRVILPIHQIDNLLCYSLTNCKTFMNFIGSRSPGGGYTHVANWLRQQCREEKPFPSGLVKAVFDNSQKIDFGN